MTNSLLTSYAVALGIGLLIGIERERRKGTGPTRAAAGVRTFTLTSLLGAVSFSLGGEIVFAICAIFVSSAILLSYYHTRVHDPGLTTEVALLMTFLLGALAMNEPALAVAIGVVVAILLAIRTRLHQFVSQVLSEQEVHDGLILAAAVLVILPLMPDRVIDPLQVINPYQLWLIVVLLMLISAIGYIATRVLGVRYGLPLAGLASGFISSAATIGAMAARAAKEPQLFYAAVAGAVLSTVATIIQLIIIMAYVSKSLLLDMWVPLLASALASVLYGVLAMRRNLGVLPQTQMQLGRAFDAKIAVIFTMLVATVLFLSTLLVKWLGEIGVLVTAAIAGAADAHSTTISIATLSETGKLNHYYAASAVLLAVTTNTVTKIVAARVAGDLRFVRAISPGLIAIVVVAWAGLAIEMVFGIL